MARMKKGGEKERAYAIDDDYQEHRKSITNKEIKNVFFQFISLRYDLERAHYLASFRKGAVVLQDLEPIVKSYRLDNPERAMVVIDVEHVKELPNKALTSPIYLCPLIVRGEGVLLVIDGWHRITKAWSMGVKQLPSITFSPIEALWISHELNIFTE